jgi:hypothetical protein
MISPERTTGVLEARPLVRRRIILALGIAIAADCLQLAISGLGWFGPDQIIDLVVMLALIPLIGFHWLLLPSFVLELVPVLDDLPTWTGCVIAVVAIRRRQLRSIKAVQ